jgi:apolipoprotein N-acyltransferase
VRARRVGVFLLLFASAGLLSLPYHFGIAWPVAFIAFVPLFSTFREKNAFQLFKICFVFGLFFHALLGYWLNYVNVLGFLLLTTYLSLFFGLFGYFCGSFFFSDKMRSAVYVGAIWVLLEYARGFLFGGFPWALLSYTQWKNLPFIQAADIIGAHGISFFVLWANVMVYRSLAGRRDWKTPLTLLAVLSCLWGYGLGCLHAREAHYLTEGPKALVGVSVVQGNIPQEEKWDSKIKNIIFEKYKRLTLMAAMEKPDLIVWPETSFPGFLEDEAVMATHLRALVRQSKTRLLVGAPTLGDLEKSLQFYNSAILFAPNGEELGRYSKVHLVPFGEYVPFEPLFGLIRHFVSIGHFSPGAEQTIFSIVTENQKIRVAAKFGVLICYEDIFPGLVRQLCLNGADFLVNITNDAWFGKSSAPYQHAQASVFRAVENRVPIVRSTNTGFSCFISAEGRVTSSVQKDGREIMVSGYKTENLVLRKGRPFFTHFGDLFFWCAAGILLFALKERHQNSPYSRL